MKAMILAAGKGTRLEPITSSVQKVMLPLGPKPILHHLVDEIKGAGIKEITLLVGHLEGQIKDYFGDGSDFGVKIDYITQKKRLGTSHALGQADFKEDFLVLNGDSVVSSKAIKEITSSHDSAVTIGIKRVDDPGNHGVVDVQDGKILKIIEKPKKPKSNLGSIGVYVFSPLIFDAIKKTKKSRRGEYELPTSIEVLIKKGEFVRGAEITEIGPDVGTPWHYLEANQEVLDGLESDIKGMVEDGATVKGELILGKGSVVKSGSYIEGPVSIGKNTVVGPNAYLREFTTIGDNCHIGASVELKNTIILEGTNVPHLAYVGDSIIGRDCNLGAGTLIGNLRLDNANVKMRVKGKLTDSGRRKLGCVIGSNTKLGLNVMVNSGRKIGNNAMVGPGVVVYKDIPDDATIRLKQKLGER
jgi:bifunctional UDP-N-acetylglucosamine pyrophosphorylase/glucosamine-1-phosphate N-acetyltransferase